MERRVFGYTFGFDNLEMFLPPQNKIAVHNFQSLLKLEGMLVYNCVSQDNTSGY